MDRFVPLEPSVPVPLERPQPAQIFSTGAPPDVELLAPGTQDIEFMNLGTQDIELLTSETSSVNPYFFDTPG